MGRPAYRLVRRLLGHFAPPVLVFPPPLVGRVQYRTLPELSGQRRDLKAAVVMVEAVVVMDGLIVVVLVLMAAAAAAAAAVVRPCGNMGARSHSGRATR